MITVIGRGHSGTRVMSQTLSASGVFMGEPLNESYDLVPPEDMYEACRVIARHVRWKGGLEWGFEDLHQVSIDHKFERLIHSYLRSVLSSPSEMKGWKIPETTLVFPWIVRMYPDMHYIFWVRDPRDCVVGAHITDDMDRFGIPHPEMSDERTMRGVSWKYQDDLVRATPKPERWIKVRYEDFVLRQDETLARLEAFLGMKMVKIPVDSRPIGRWKTDEGLHDFSFLKPAMQEHGYAGP